MIFVDSNVPMYLVGAEHPHKHDARRLVHALSSAGELLLTDAEVLQGICHRYVSVRRHDMLQPAFDSLLGVVDDVLPIERQDVEAAKDTLLRYPALSARDAVHAAVMDRHGVSRILSFDRGFDALPGVERLS